MKNQILILAMAFVFFGSCSTMREWMGAPSQEEFEELQTKVTELEKDRQALDFLRRELVDVRDALYRLEDELEDFPATTIRNIADLLNEALDAREAGEIVQPPVVEQPEQETEPQAETEGSTEE